MAGYTFRAAGTVASNNDSTSLSPGAPSGKAVGDLLILVTGNHAAATTPPTVTGYRLMDNSQSNGTIAIYMRIADGTSADTPTVDWSGSLDSYAWIEAYNGDVYPDLSSILLRKNADNASQAAPIAPVCSIATNDHLLFLATQKRKTATSDNATTITAPASQSLVKRQQLIMAGTALVAASASVQQTTATAYDGTDFTINGTAEALGSCGIALVIRPLAGYISTIQRDTETANTRTLTTSPQTYSHAGAASGVKGVVLCIVHGTSSTDHVSAASYGGTAMTRHKRNTDTLTEPGAAEIWFLGGAGVSIPQGTQTVSYTPGATTDDIYSCCITLLCDKDLEVIDTDGIDNNVANPSVTLQANSRELYCVGALYGGGPGPPSSVVNGNCQDMPSADLGNFYGQTIVSSYSRPGDFTIGSTAGTDDVAYSAIAIAPVQVRGPSDNIRGSHQAVRRASSF